MTFREQTEDEVEDLGGDDERAELEGIDVDFGETAFVKLGAGVFPTGTFPEGEGNPVIRFAAPDYNEGRYDQGYLGLVLDELDFVVDEDEGTDGTVVLDTADDDTTEYRVFNTNAKDTQEKDYGVKFAGDIYEGDKVDPADFDEERVVLIISGGGSWNVARKLDIRGGPAANQVWNEEGGYAQTNGGLVEYNPDDESEEPYRRYARNNVQLRDELLGTEVGILCDWRSEFDDDFAEELEADENRNDSKWFSVFNMETEEPLEAGNYGEPVERAYLNWNWDEDFTAADDPTTGETPDLTEDEEAFVESYREQGLDTDEESVREEIANNEEAFDGSPDEEAIVEALA